VRLLLLEGSAPLRAIQRFIGDDGDQAVHEMVMISAAHPAKSQVFGLLTRKARGDAKAAA